MKSDDIDEINALNAIIMDDVILRKSDSSLRWVVLVLNFIIMVGVYYAFDFPAPMKNQMDNYMGNPSNFETMFAFLYTIPAMPNIILPFFGGYFVDTLGAAKCMIVFMSLMAGGTAIFALGLSMKSWPIMFIGRAMFGMGETSNSVGNSTIIADWFGGKELSLAFGLCLAISRMASVVNNVSSPKLAQAGGIVFSAWCGVILLVAGVVSACIVYPIDAKMEVIVERNGAEQRRLLKEQGVYNPAIADSDLDLDHPRGMSFDEKTRAVSAEGAAPSMLASASGVTVDGKDGGRMLSREKNNKDNGKANDGTGTEDWVTYEEENPENEEKIKFTKFLEFPLMYRLLTVICLLIYGIISPFNNIASTLLLERSYFMVPPDNCLLSIPNACQNSTNGPHNCPSSQYYQYPLPIDIEYDGKYYKKMTADDVDCTSDTWKNGCAKDFCNRLDKSIIEANTIMSIPYFMAAILLPFLGGFVDKFGLRAFVLLLVPIGLLIVHSLLGFTDINPIGLLVGQGLGYTCMAATLWPSFSLIIEQRYTGLAFGIAFSMQNLGLSVIPFIIAVIYGDSGDKYIPNVEVFFMGLAGVCIFFALWLNFCDFKAGWLLNSPIRAEPKGNIELFTEEHKREEDDSYNVYAPLNKSKEEY